MGRKASFAFLLHLRGIVMTTNAHTLHQVCRAASALFELPVAELRAELDLIEHLGADSIDLAELVFFLQEEFQITLPEPSPADLTTLGSVAQWVQGFLPSTDIGRIPCPTSLPVAPKLSLS